MLLTESQMDGQTNVRCQKHTLCALVEGAIQIWSQKYHSVFNAQTQALSDCHNIKPSFPKCFCSLAPFHLLYNNIIEARCPTTTTACTVSLALPNAALLNQLCYCQQLSCLFLESSAGFSLCSGWKVPDFPQVEANILRHMTLGSLHITHHCTGKAQGKICVVIFSCPFVFLFYCQNVCWFIIVFLWYFHHIEQPMQTLYSMFYFI